jgi:retinol dehydrogenase 12
MTGKVCMVTGATSGLGLATARQLAERGATVVVVGRNAARASSAAQEVARAGPHAPVAWLAADFAVQGQVRELAAEVIRRYPYLNVLVNNAGTICRHRKVTPEGVELTLAVNHLAPFLLTNLLLESLEAGAPARVVNVASAAHERARLDLADPAMRRRHLPFRAYAASKLANVLFTYELARRLESTGVTANAVDPGLVRTGLGRNNGLARDLAWRLTHLRYRSLSLSPDQGADSIVFLASSPTLLSVNGEYFSRWERSQSSPSSRDIATAQRLWALSEQWTGLRQPYQASRR